MNEWITITANDYWITFKTFTGMNSFSSHINLRGEHHFYPHLEKKLRDGEISELAQSQSRQVEHKGLNLDSLAQKHMLFIYFLLLKIWFF